MFFFLAGWGRVAAPAPADSPRSVATYERAEKIARDLISTSPADGRAHLILASALESRGKRPEAERTLRDALGLVADPRAKAEILDRLGSLAFARDAPAEAVPFYEEAIRSDPKWPGVHGRLGIALAALGRTEEAIARYRQEIGSAPRDAMTHFLLGQTLLQTGRAAEAKPIIERAVALDPASPNPHYALAQCLRSLGDAEGADRALAEFRKRKLEEKRARLAEIRTRDDAARAAAVLADIAMRAASLHAQANRTAQAESCLLEAARVRPDDAATHRALALFYLQVARNAAAALRAASRAVEIEPTAAHYDLLGWALFVGGDPAGAEQATERAIALDPKNPAYAERLARIRKALGR